MTCRCCSPYERQQVESMFKDYCKVFDIHLAYGVEDWDVNDDNIVVVQDISARSCHNATTHTLPLSYMESEGEDRLALMQRDHAAHIVAEQQRKRAFKQNRLIALEAQIAAIRNELSE